MPTLVAEKTSTDDLMAEAERLGAAAASLFGQLLPILGELDRRQAFRSEGATSMATWITERCGVSTATARMWTTVAQALWDLPQLAAALLNGSISLDKARAAAELATPETDADVLAQARECSVHQLTEMAKNRQRPTDEDAEAEYEARYLRFNDERRTITAMLPPVQYAQARSIIEGAARDIPSDGFTRWDQRLADGFLQILGTPVPGSDTSSGSTAGTAPRGRTSRFLVVVHTDLAYLQGGEGSAEIERLGLLSHETIRRITCDADVILAVDDDVGHTMFEGRRHRYPTPTQRREVKRRDRHCRFPGCTNVLFTDVHHIVHWTPSGLTDLPNLVLLCSHHHDRIHSGGWSASGDANVELTFVGPSGRPMSSRPSPLWTKSERPKSGRAPAS